MIMLLDPKAKSKLKATYDVSGAVDQDNDLIDEVVTTVKAAKVTKCEALICGFIVQGDKGEALRDRVAHALRELKPSLNADAKETWQNVLFKPLVKKVSKIIEN